MADSIQTLQQGTTVVIVTPIVISNVKSFEQTQIVGTNTSFYIPEGFQANTSDLYSKA